MSVVITKATPAPGVAKLRVPEAVWAKWTERLRIIRTCQCCCTTYQHAGAAWVCEHYHQPVP